MQTTEAEISTVRKLVDQFVFAYNTGNAPVIASLFTEDGVLMPPGERPIRGRDAIKWRFQVFFDGFTFDLELYPRETSVAGNMCFERGAYSAYALPTEGGSPRGGEGDYVFIFIQDQNGFWKITAFGTSALEARQSASGKVVAWDHDSSTDWGAKWAETLADVLPADLHPDLVEKLTNPEAKN